MTDPTEPNPQAKLRDHQGTRTPMESAETSEKTQTTISGGCRCGSVRYVINGQPRRHSLCCCADCRRSAGAPIVGWAVVKAETLTVTGNLATFNSSGDVERSFCPRCGTGLFYRSETLFPGSIDVQSSTFDDPNILPPTEIIQMAEAPSWLPIIGTLPQHRRFPQAS